MKNKKKISEDMINQINSMLQKKMSLEAIAKELNFYDGTSMKRSVIGQDYRLTEPQFVLIQKNGN